MRIPALLAVASFLFACGAPVNFESEYLFLDRLHTKLTSAEGPYPTRTVLLEMRHDQRKALTQHPPSSLRFASVPSQPGAIFHGAPSILPKAWKAGTDGVRFQVFCRSPEAESIRLLDFRLTQANWGWKWHDKSVPLDRCSTPTTELELRTSCGPRKNCSADWAIWGNPHVTYPRQLTTGIRELVLVISIDTLRPDRLGCYGASRNTSPELDRFASDAVTFETALASSPWTLPSHATLLTSTYPLVHGATRNIPIPEKLPLFAEILRDEGWRTAGFVDSAYLDRKFGFSRGFEHYDDEEPLTGGARRGAQALHQHLLEWMNGVESRRAFVFWHIMDVHGPYGAPAPHGGTFRSTLWPDGEPDPRLEYLEDVGYHDYLELHRFSSFEDLLATYDEGIATVDSLVGELFDLLRDLGLYQDALIVVTSDHGESFLDHGVWVGHGMFLTDDEIRVPLLMKLPDNHHAGTRVRTPVGLVDVAPTILGLLDVPAPPTFQGRDLLPVIAGKKPRPPYLFGSSSNTGARFVRGERFKYVGPMGVDLEYLLREHFRPEPDVELPIEGLTSEQLYDLLKDPGEALPDISDEERAQLDYLRDLLARYEQSSIARRRELGGGTQPLPKLNPRERARLRALGYLD